MTPEEERTVRDKYEADWRQIENARKELEAYVSQVCARLARDSDFRPRFVEARPKPVPSILRKLQEKEAGPDELYEAVGDLLGARVVVYNLCDAKVFREEVLADEACPLAPLVPEDVEYPTGYRAIHVNGHLGQYGCEIQIRTAVQDAWAVTSRADVYHARINPLIKKLSTAQASILNGVDDVLQAIRDLGEKSGSDEIEAASPQPDPDGDLGAPRPPEGIDDSRMRSAKGALKPEELYVLNSPISEERVAAFRTGIESERTRSTVRQLFRAVEGYARRYEYESTARYGIRANAWKGPLVEGSNWAEYNPTDFARMFERGLQRRFGERLQGRSTSTRTLRSWEEIADFIREATRDMEGAERQADLLVIQGEVDQSLENELLANTDWTATPAVRGVDVSSAGLWGDVINGLPVLRIHDTQPPPSIHVVDLTGFRYEQTNPDAMSDDDLLVRVEPYNFELAAEAVDKNPDLLSSLYRTAYQEEGQLDREEAIVRMQLNVRLHLIEGRLIQAQDGAMSVSSAALLGSDP